MHLLNIYVLVSHECSEDLQVYIIPLVRSSFPTDESIHINTKEKINPFSNLNFQISWLNPLLVCLNLSSVFKQLHVFSQLLKKIWPHVRDISRVNINTTDTVMPLSYSLSFQMSCGQSFNTSECLVNKDYCMFFVKIL